MINAAFLASLPLHMSLFLSAMAIGVIVFFAAGVAPVVHKVLDKEKASAVMRAVFPIYYLVLAALCALAAVAAIPVNPVAFIVLAVIAGGFVFARQIILPRINALRQEVARGSVAARGPFDMMHAWSTRMNMLQLGVLVLVFWFLAPVG
jgi:hypothetical protein